MGGRELVHRVDVIDLDGDVLSALEPWQDLLVDRDQRIVDVLPAVFAVNDRHSGTARHLRERFGETRL